MSVPYETATPVTLACTVGDPSDPGSAQPILSPAHGTFGFSTRVYTPAAGYVGPDTASYQLFNGDGNSAIATVHFTVLAPAAPTITGTTPPSPAQTASPHVLGTAPAGSTVSLYATADCSGTPVATGAAGDFASPGIVVPTSGDGSTTISARYVNSELVTSSCSAPITFTVDTAPPDTTIDSGPSATTTDAQPTFTFHSSEPGAAFECSIDTGTPAFAPCSGPGAHRPEAALAPGGYTFRVRAIDSAGNTDPTPAQLAFTVDASGGGTGAHPKRPNTILVKHPKSKLTVKTKKTKVKVSFSFRSSPTGATFTCKLDKQKAKTCRSPVRYRVGRGKHLFTVTAKTKAGADLTPARFRFTVTVRKRHR